jgi:lipopolysaccharide transport protein LptA
MAAGLIAVATISVTTGEVEAQSQKFKLRDLFQNKAEANSKAKQVEAKGGADKTADTTEPSTDKAEPTMEKADPAKSVEKAPVKTSASGDTTKVAASQESTTGKLKELSKSEQLKSLTGKLDKAGGDPDALLQSARERFRAMKAEDSSSKAEPAAVTRSSAAVPATQKGTEATENQDAPAGKMAVVETQPSPVASPVSTAAKPVTGGAAVSGARTADSSRPPSLTSAVAVAAVESEVEVPPENLQLSLAGSNVPPPRPLVPANEKKGDTNAMEITSEEVEMDNAERTTTFIGNVDLKHPTFHLKSDRLLIYMNEENQSAEGKKSEGETDAPFKEAVATGARVIVERVNADGKKDVGQARKVVYDALTGDLVLSGGPPQLQSGGSLVKTYSESATITLKKNGNHSVSDKGVGGGNKVIIPVGKDNKGGESKEPNLIPTKLGDISKRK